MKAPSILARCLGFGVLGQEGVRYEDQKEIDMESLSVP